MNAQGKRKYVKIAEQAAFSPRDGAGAVVNEGKMWLLGGWNPGDKPHFPRICNNEVWSSKDGTTWTLEKPNTFLDASFDPSRDWEGRHTAGYVVFKDRMWIVGGDANQHHYQNDVWSSADGVNWECHTASAPWHPRQYHDVAVFDGQLWVLEGWNRDNRNDVWHSADGVDWHELPNNPWPPRHAASVFVHDGALWVVAGNNMTSDIWKLVRTDTN